MQTLHPSTLPTDNTAVTYDPKSESVRLPGGVVSVAGITVVTGGVELSCSSCMLAFGFWGTLIGFSCVGVGVWDQLNHSGGGTSHLLALGLVILALGFAVVVGVAAFHVLTKRRRAMTRNERRDGKEVLVEENVVKKVTV
uniref:transmembrane protein 100-like n=1 Tax=Doryrhamphus excisus TaxID=161450 RepID=UPI0025ADCA9A|nr:transmembrane protein 100-like [Doryrhamphus excisus]